MSSITDQIADKIESAMPDAASKSSNAISSGINTGGKVVKTAGKVAVKGIVLIISGVELTRENVMNAVKDVALTATKDLKYSNRNLDISELKDKGTVRKIDESITQDVMYFFDKNCKKFGLQYNIMKDTKEDNRYYIFFNGRDETVIHAAIEKSYKDYVEDKGKKAERQEKVKNVKESALAKLAFFRNCVTAREGNDVDRSKEAEIQPPELTK